MHLSVDSLRSVEEVRAALPLALASHGLLVDRTRETAGGGVVVELVDPLPLLDAEAPGLATGSTYAVAAFPRAEGGTRLSTVDPVALVAGMDRPLVEASARALGRTLVAALLDAAGRSDERPPA